MRRVEGRACFLPLRPLPLRPFLQSGTSAGRVSERFPLWASNLTIARLVERQRLVELTSRPFLAPCMVRTNLVTGASGTSSKVLRICRP